MSEKLSGAEKLVAGPLRGARDLLERVKDIHPCGTCGHKRSDHAMDLEGDHFCEWNDLANGCHCRNYVGVFAPSYDELVAALASLPSSPPHEQKRLTCICGVTFALGDNEMLQFHDPCPKARFINDSCPFCNAVAHYHICPHWNPASPVQGVRSQEWLDGYAKAHSEHPPHDWHGHTPDGVWHGCPGHPGPVQGVQAQPFAYVCPANCGCMWRDNQDGTMSLFGKRSQSCEVCETLALSALTPVYIAAGQCASIEDATNPVADPEYVRTMEVPEVPAPPVAEKTELDQAGRGEPRHHVRCACGWERFIVGSGTEVGPPSRSIFVPITDMLESHANLCPKMKAALGAALGSGQELREALRLRATELHVDQNGSGLPLRGYDQCHKHGFETCKSPKCVDARAALALPLAPKVPRLDLKLFRDQLVDGQILKESDGDPWPLTKSEADQIVAELKNRLYLRTCPSCGEGYNVEECDLCHVPTVPLRAERDGGK
jgi:hypothetical protein